MPSEKQMPVTKKGREMRMKLKVAGREVFGEKGYLDTRVSDITKRANISEGNFYRYFINKDDILEELIEDMVNEIYEESGVSSTVVDQRTRLEISIKNLLLTYKKHRNLYKVLIQVSNFNPNFKEKWKRLRKPFVMRVRGALEKRGMKEEYDLDYMASALGNMVQQFAYIWCVLDGEDIDKTFDIDIATKTLAEMWYQTLLAFEKENESIN